MSTQVKAKIKIGTLQYEAGTFQKGEVITVSEERFKLFDPRDIEFIGLAQAEAKPVEAPKVEAAKVEAKPLGEIVQETVKAVTAPAANWGASKKKTTPITTT